MNQFKIPKQDSITWELQWAVRKLNYKWYASVYYHLKDYLDYYINNHLKQ